MLGVAAERAVAAAVEECPRLFHFRKQPIGHVYRAYSNAQRKATGCYGAKIFFFSAAVINPYETLFAEPPEALKPMGGAGADFGWWTKGEVCEQAADQHLKDYFGHLLS